MFVISCLATYDLCVVLSFALENLWRLLPLTARAPKESGRVIRCPYESCDFFVEYFHKVCVLEKRRLRRQQPCLRKDRYFSEEYFFIAWRMLRINYLEPISCHDCFVVSSKLSNLSSSNGTNSGSCASRKISSSNSCSSLIVSRPELLDRATYRLNNRELPAAGRCDMSTMTCGMVWP